MALVFKLDPNAPTLIREVLVTLGWSEFVDGRDHPRLWNLWWKTSAFRDADMKDAAAHQRLNHFPNTMLMTKKDCLERNLRRMTAIHGRAFVFAPLTFILPSDHERFITAFAVEQSAGQARAPTWICKPADGRQGAGIFLFRVLADLQYATSCVVQRYIERPLTINGYKIDVRLYVAVTSYHPLTVFVYREGLTRFGTVKYSLEAISDPYMHLTNTSINKHSPTLGVDKDGVGLGCKWTLGQLRAHFHAHGIAEGRYSLLWTHVVEVVTLTLLSLVSDVPNVKHCFEMYGFDVLIDADMRPWLLEIKVNKSPALTIDCPQDDWVKRPLLRDLMVLQNFPPSESVVAKLSAGSAGPGPLPTVFPKGSKGRAAIAAEALEACVPAVGSRVILTMMALQANAWVGHYAPVQVGDFMRVFPFNEPSHSAAAALRKKFDMKTILAEIKARIMWARELVSSADTAAGAANVANFGGSQRGPSLNADVSVGSFYDNLPLFWPCAFTPHK